MTKKNLIRYLSVICLGLVSFWLIQSARHPYSLQKIARVSVNNWHFNPKTINNDYSADVYDMYLKELDVNKRFFLQSDINEFSYYKNALDDEFKNDTYSFYSLVQKRLGQRRDQVKAFYPSLLSYPYNFSLQESFESEPEKRDYAHSQDDLFQSWRKMIKYEILNQYLLLVEAKSTSTDAKKKEKQLALNSNSMDQPLLKDAIKKVKKNLKTSFTHMEEETEEEKRHRYLETFLNVFDTHTGYFPPQKKEDFDISISGRLEGIGAVLKEDDGFIKVVQIVPGSASWRQGDLKAEDLILKVAQETGEPVDLVGKRVKYAVKLIRGEKGSLVKLTVKKPDGKIIVVPIIRDVVIIEESYAKSAVVTDSRYKQSYGYIYLPKFYRDFQSAKSRNTTDDIRNILLSFQDKGLSGVVLDLRNNEGGALLDAINTAGLFIKKGPIVQVKGRKKKTSVLYDSDKNSYYDGPLLVLVNQYSASASEILAAALQDYARAVIVGTSDTFGKGTVQTFVELDKVFPTIANPDDPLGSLKLTIQKFYRINGGSTQYKGVSPDIRLPNPYGYLEIGERHLDHSLPWDTVSKLNYEPWNPNLGLDVLRRQSRKRVQKSPLFSEVKQHVSFVKSERDRTDVPLKLERIVRQRKKVDDESKKYKAIKKELKHLSWKDTTPYITTDKDLESRQEDWLKNLGKDIYLNECFSILHDMTDYELATLSSY